VYEQDDLGDEDDIAGSYGRAFFDEKLVWVNMRYADNPTLVREILLHEIAHAHIGHAEDNQHGQEFRVKLREIGGSVAEPATSADTRP
jgi:predicted SprT family Zn-dependent metalloprotease